MFTFPLLGFLEYSSNLANLFVSFVMAVFLFCFRTGRSDNAYGFNYLLKCLAWSVLAIAVLDSFSAYMALAYNGVSLLKQFLLPLVCYVHLHLVSSALFSLVRSSHVLQKKIRWLLVPVFVLCIVYSAFYLAENGFHLCYSCYASFCEEYVANTLSFILYMLILIELFFYSAFIVRQSWRYKEEIDDFFAGNKEEKINSLLNIVYCFIAYFFISTINFMFAGFDESDYSYYANMALTWVSTVLFVLSSVRILNSSRFYYSVEPAFAWKDEEENDALPLSDNTVVEAEETNSGVFGEESNDDNRQDANSQRSMETVIKEWIALPSKPYLRESLTLAIAARQMNIHTRLLSSFLNSIYHMNFNSWINSLRVEEVKRMIDEEPHQTLLSIALRTGFTDASAMSRVFKKFVGVSPSEYRNKS